MHFPLPALTASCAECVVFMLTRQSEGSLGQSDANCCWCIWLAYVLVQRSALT